MKKISLIEQKKYSKKLLSEKGLGDSTLSFLKKNNIIVYQKNSIQFNFIGSIFIDQLHILIYPKYRTVPFLEEELHYFHNALIKFNNSVGLFEDEGKGNWCEVYEVLSDYKTNGFLNTYTNVQKSDWSNPNWNRMFSEKPFFHKKNPYWEPISSQKHISSDNIKTLHIQILIFIIDSFPILKNYFPFFNLEYNSILNKEVLSNRINNFLRNTSLSREKTILKKSLKIINSDLKNEGFIIGTKHVHIFWEHLLKKHLNDQSFLWTKSFPKANWSIKESTGETASLKPDIICEDKQNNIIFLYDAKYYDTSQNRPGIQDITKQFLYAQCIKSIKNVKIHNGFIFPSQNSYDCFKNKTGQIDYNLFSNEKIYTHHQYDIELFKNFDTNYVTQPFPINQKIDNHSSV